MEIPLWANSNMDIKQNSCNFPSNRLPLRNVSNKASSLPALNKANRAGPDPAMFFHRGVEFQFPYMIEVFDSWNFCSAGSKHLWECSSSHPCCTCLQTGWGCFVLEFPSPPHLACLCWTDKVSAYLSQEHVNDLFLLYSSPPVVCKC